MRLPKYFYFRVKSGLDKILLEDASHVDVVEVVRCRDCIHAPLPGEVCYGLDIEWPKTEYGNTDDTCPFCIGDRWYCKRPEPDFFCGKGERKIVHNELTKTDRSNEEKQSPLC